MYSGIAGIEGSAAMSGAGASTGGGLTTPCSVVIAGACPTGSAIGGFATVFEDAAHPETADIVIKIKNNFIFFITILQVCEASVIPG